MGHDRILFLDVDGVLNGHDWDAGAQSNRIRYRCVRALNLILEKAQPKIVLSSAWRYMIHGRAMKPLGFEYMLRTHGACGIVGRIIDVTIADETCARCGHKHRRRSGGRQAETGYRLCDKCGDVQHRAAQIQAWIRDHGPVTSFVILDDEDYEFTAEGMGDRFVQTNPRTGLSLNKASQVVGLFK